MASQFQSRPSELLGVSDKYAAYCLDEAVYFFGSHVESELHRVAAGKKSEEAARARKDMLTQLLYDPPEQADGGPPLQHDPTDPVSPETAARMSRSMPPVKFTGQQFADPADLFNGTKKPKTVIHI